MMNRMVKADTVLAAQAHDSVCVILHVLEARSGGHKKSGL